MTIALDTLQLTPDFVREFRKLGHKVGYRNLGRAIAYASPSNGNGTGHCATPIIAPNGNGHKPTCAETAERIQELMGGQGDVDFFARQVHNQRVLAVNNAGEGSGVEGCPCGDTCRQYAEVAPCIQRARAAPRSRPYKGKRGYRQCCRDAAALDTTAFHRHIETHWTQWPSVLRWAGEKWELERRCELVAQNLPARVCCKHKMGLTPDYTDAHHWRYQCDKNPDHCQDVMITIGPS